MSLASPKEFYERFKDDPEGARREAFQLGQRMGHDLLRKVGARDSDLETVAAMLNEFQKTVQGDPNAKVEDNKITMNCMGLCPVMRAALTLNIPWEWLDNNLALPMFEGMTSSIIPDMKVRLLLAKSRGDSVCAYLFET